MLLSALFLAFGAGLWYDSGSFVRKVADDTTSNFYLVLSYMSRRGRYPNGIDRKQLTSRFGKDIVDELLYYDYLESTGDFTTVRITVRGRESLKVHVLTVLNVVTAILALAVSVVALLL